MKARIRTHVVLKAVVAAQVTVVRRHYDEMRRSATSRFMQPTDDGRKERYFVVAWLLREIPPLDQRCKR